MLELNIQLFAEDGKIVIGTALDTKQIERDLKKLEKEISTYEKSLDKMTSKQASMEVEINVKSDEFDRKIKEIKEKQKIQLQSNVSGTIFQRQTRADTINANAEMQINKIIEERDRYYAQMDEKQASLSREIKQTEEALYKSKEDAKELNENLGKAKFYGDIKDTIKGVEKGLKRSIEKVKTLVLGIFSIRGAYSAVRNAINIISSDDQQMKADIDEINKEIEQLKKVINILNNKI